LFSRSIPPLFVLSHNMPMINTTSNWLRFGAFYHRGLLRFAFTGHWLLTTILPPLASRPTPHASRPTTPGPAGSGRAQTLPRWLLPDTNRRFVKDRTGPALDERPLHIQYVTEKAIPAEKSIRSSLLAAVGPLTILSWPEALNASRSKRACRMAIRRNACSLLALPDFPEFAQAV